MQSVLFCQIAVTKLIVVLQSIVTSWMTPLCCPVVTRGDPKELSVIDGSVSPNVDIVVNVAPIGKCTCRKSMVRIRYILSPTQDSMQYLNMLQTRKCHRDSFASS